MMMSMAPGATSHVTLCAPASGTEKVWPSTVTVGSSPDAVQFTAILCIDRFGVRRVRSGSPVHRAFVAELRVADSEPASVASRQDPAVGDAGTPAVAEVRRDVQGARVAGAGHRQVVTIRGLEVHDDLVVGDGALVVQGAGRLVVEPITVDFDPRLAGISLEVGAPTSVAGPGPPVELVEPPAPVGPDPPSPPPPHAEAIKPKAKRNAPNTALSGGLDRPLLRPVDGGADVVVLRPLRLLHDRRNTDRCAGSVASQMGHHSLGRVCCRRARNPRQLGDEAAVSHGSVGLVCEGGAPRRIDPVSAGRADEKGVDAPVADDDAARAQPVPPCRWKPLAGGERRTAGRLRWWPGRGGRIEELDPDGDVVWRFDDADDQVMFRGHHLGSPATRHGDPLIVYGTLGRMIEVTPAGKIMWNFENPYDALHPDTPARTGAGFVVEPWRTFRARRYAPDDPAIIELGVDSRVPTEPLGPASDAR